ncbi:hypothetical protein EYF80_066772 [Liparis tanakae]|uniref:Uncharacterized protein n=1 Tax=Liparis tanakae TaxID=230148 RepID=A0A4Z2E313_9TELE|nr:hypothetical protein EYF80_066772 [Liparis tanakae]
MLHLLSAILCNVIYKLQCSRPTPPGLARVAWSVQKEANEVAAAAGRLIIVPSWLQLTGASVLWTEEVVTGSQTSCTQQRKRQPLELLARVLVEGRPAAPSSGLPLQTGARQWDSGKKSMRQSPKETTIEGLRVLVIY